MLAHPTIEMGRQPLHLLVRRIGVSTMYAWTRVMEAYSRRHPLQQVHVFYHRNRVQDLKLLVKHSPQLDSRGFEVKVVSPNEELEEVPRLMKLLEEAATPQGQHFLTDANPSAWFEAAQAAS
jgi:hypothetical protein